MGQAGDPIRAARGTADGVQLGSYLVSYLVGWLVDGMCRPSARHRILLLYRIVLPYGYVCASMICVHVWWISTQCSFARTCKGTSFPTSGLGVLRCICTMLHVVGKASSLPPPRPACALQHAIAA